MRYSANLNIIIKSIEKATFKTSRDFYELEILQNNPRSATKFANSCYSRVKEVLIEDLTKMRPSYNIIFSDGQEIINDEKGEFSYVIFPIDGLNNLSRSLSECSIAIALVHKDENGDKQSIAVAIYKIIGGDLFYCEKGFGAFLNDRKAKTSRRNNSDTLLSCFGNENLLKKASKEINAKNIVNRNFGCKTLEIAYLSSGKIDLGGFSKENLKFLKPFLLIISESGGKANEVDELVLYQNGNLS